MPSVETATKEQRDLAPRTSWQFWLFVLFLAIITLAVTIALANDLGLPRWISPG